MRGTPTTKASKCVACRKTPKEREREREREREKGR